MSNLQLKYVIRINRKQSGQYTHAGRVECKCGICAKHDDSIK